MRSKNTAQPHVAEAGLPNKARFHALTISASSDLEYDWGNALTKEGCVHEGQLELEEMLVLVVDRFQKAVS